MQFRRTTRLITSSLIAASLLSLAAPVGTNTAGATTTIKKYKLLWSQEFTGKSGVFPSPSVWSYDIGDGSVSGNPGWGNNEQEYYTNRNARLDGSGHMVITAKRIPTEQGPTEQYPYFCPQQPTEVCPWISSRIKTQGKIGFIFGRIEARMKMPAGDGTWPAFWLLGANIESKGWPGSGEIDIMEGTGSDPFRASGAVHGPGYSGADARSAIKYSTTSLQSSYHVYALEWTRDRIEWYLDGKRYYTLTASMVKPNTWPMNREFFLIMNLAIGGWFVGNVVDPTLQSASYSIDYIRYYSINGVGRLVKH